jgi:hypothetical protein
LATGLPKLKIDYLESFTDDTGIFQHGRYCIPRRDEGYTTDDNARALIVCTRYHRLSQNKRTERLASIYLAFLYHMQKQNGYFHNYLGYDRRYLDVDGSDDCIGRALWSLGCTVNSTLKQDFRMFSKDNFDRGLSAVERSISLRCHAHTILGLYEYYQAFQDNNIKSTIERLANNLVMQYQHNSHENWRWFEPHLTYDNARLPQALFKAYMINPAQEYLDVAKESMAFQVNTQFVDNMFVPIGNNGWYKQGSERAIYDQQPLEACAMVDAAADAFYATKDKSYLKIANVAFQWYLGRNTKNTVLYNSATGGCYDGLNSGSVNLNQGAESSLSYLLARLRLEELKHVLGREKVNLSTSVLDNIVVN